MTMTRFTLKAFAFLALTIAFATAAQAQATRTWVSGVGDDVNPCSRTAPCKTWAGAISKTANNGEIDALDPGGFGTVTITKNITIDGTTGQGFGSILAAGTNGVNVNDVATATPNTIIVILRNLSINGAGTGFDGVRFVSGKALHVENCEIFGFKGNGVNSDGIDVALSAIAAGNQNLTVKNTKITNNTGNGIRTSNTAVGGGVLVAIDGLHADSNAGAGVLAATASAVTIVDSYLKFNGNGVQSSAGLLGVEVDNSLFVGNANGILAATGTIRIANCRITQNANGINFTGGIVSSYGDNKIKGNFTNDQLGGAVTAIAAPAKV
ncbi:MAG TPA: right-handed parallel beta-helix repeat-containing protein [Pyrinomonadaceae bacterium]|nr:right-handed parallel beta-helix repeat-containing protein [Pyrinomonadaceae bacterium]